MPGDAARRWRHLGAVALTAAAAAALFLPWWRPATGPVLLGAGTPRELEPDSWAGTEVAGLRVVLVVVLAVAAAVAVSVRGRVPALAATATVAAGAAAATCGFAALVGWGPTEAPGVWLALVAGGAAVLGHAAPRRPLPVRAGTALAVALTVATPGGPDPPVRPAAGPYRPVAAIGGWPVRSGAPGLPGTLDTARPVVVEGAPGVVTAAGVVVAHAGRARVLARTTRGAPAPLGVAGDRVVLWTTVDTLAVVELRGGDPSRVVVRDVGAASPLGADGSVWLRSDVDPPGTVRRLDLAAHPGPQSLSATYLPVVTIQNPGGEAPVDVRAVLPVPGGALRLADGSGTRQLQLLTSTPAGITATPVAGAVDPSCGAAGGLGGDLRVVAADEGGVWFPVPGRAGDRLVHLDRDGVARVVAAPLPGRVGALAAPGDGSLLLTAHDARGDALWRLPDARAALTDPAPGCPPGG